MTRTSDVMLPDFVQGIGPEFQQGLRGLTWEGRPPKQPRLLKSWAQSTSCCSEKRVIMPVLMAFTASMAPTVEKVQQLPHLPCHAQRFWTLSLLWLFPAPPAPYALQHLEGKIHCFLSSSTCPAPHTTQANVCTLAEALPRLQCLSVGWCH